jgi:hypothetical protein
LSNEVGREMRQELNDTGLVFCGETRPDLSGWDGSPFVRNPYAHRSISLIQGPDVRGWWGDATAIRTVSSGCDHQ